MKFVFVINQAGVVRCGLLGRVDLAALCVLDYLGGWFFSDKARRVVVDGREYVWLQYEHAVSKLPLLLNPQAGLPTRKNQLSRLVQGLRDAGLVETVRVGRDLYLRPSDLAAALASSRERNATKSAPIVTPKHDDSSPTNIVQTTISKTTIRETNPHSPPAGDGELNPVQSSSGIGESIYAAYPKQVGKPAALRAIRRALKQHGAGFLLERTQLFARTYNGEPRFIPHPATWFNDERFNDDPATWRRSAPANSASSAKVVPPRQFNRANRNQFLEDF